MICRSNLHRDVWRLQFVGVGRVKMPLVRIHPSERSPSVYQAAGNERHFNVENVQQGTNSLLRGRTQPYGKFLP